MVRNSASQVQKSTVGQKQNWIQGVGGKSSRDLKRRLRPTHTFFSDCVWWKVSKNRTTWETPCLFPEKSCLPLTVPLLPAATLFTARFCVCIFSKLSGNLAVVCLFFFQCLQPNWIDPKIKIARAELSDLVFHGEQVNYSNVSQTHCVENTAGTGQHEVWGLFGFLIIFQTTISQKSNLIDLALVETGVVGWSEDSVLSFSKLYLYTKAW